MRVPVQLFDYATEGAVEGELFDEVTMEHFLETQRDWRPAVIEAAKAMLKSGAPREGVPRHFHWDWSKQGGRSPNARLFILRDYLRGEAARAYEA